MKNTLVKMSDKPRVSIGLPVYNGERYIEEALDSILAQTYINFELIISDNASTDRTPEICLAYVNKDSRIRYYRNEKNFGAAWNFNRVFKLSVGEYFKWAAHDDVLSSDFLLKCVNVLDRDPSVVLCYSKVKIMDEHGIILKKYSPELDIDSQKKHIRFRHSLRGHACFEIFGLIRADVLKKTQLMGNYAHGDRVLLVKLGLLGRMYEIPEYLFFPRRHQQQSTNMFGSYDSKVGDYHSYTIWFDPLKKGKIIFPHWVTLSEYCTGVLKTQMSWYERIYCFFFISNWMRRWFPQLIKDLSLASKQIMQNNYSYLKRFIGQRETKSDST